MEVLATMQDFKKYLDTKIVIEKNYYGYYQANEELLDLIIQEEYVGQTEKGDIPKVVEEFATDYGDFSYVVYNSKEEVIEDLEGYIKDKIEEAVDDVASNFYLLNSFSENHYYDSKYYDDFVDKNTDDLFKGIPKNKLFDYLVNSSNMAEAIANDYEEVLSTIYFEDGYYDDFLDEMVDENFDFIVNEDVDYLRDQAQLGNLYYIPTGEKVGSNFNYRQSELLKFYRECALDEIVGNGDLIDPYSGTAPLFEIR